MRYVQILIIAGCLVLIGAFAMKNARADEWDKMTKMTFNEPVELPGVVLSPGTYIFRLLDDPGERDVVQVFNQDRSKIYATILAIPDYRMEPTGKTVVSFEERTKGAPEAIKAWFYPGDNYGLEFVYPKPRAVELARTNQQSVPSMPAEMAKSTKPQELRQAPVKAIQPSGNEVQLAEARQPAPPPAPAAAKPEQTSTPPAKELPKTASELPLVLMLGVLGTGGGLVLRSLSKSTL